MTYFLSITGSVCLLVLFFGCNSPIVLCCFWEWWQSAFVWKENQILLGVRKPNTCLIFSLLSVIFLVEYVLKTTLFFYLESFAILHQDNWNFIKQIRIVYKTTVIFCYGFGSRFVLKYFIFILIQGFCAFWLLFLQICSLGTSVCRCSKLDLLKRFPYKSPMQLNAYSCVLLTMKCC